MIAAAAAAALSSLLMVASRGGCFGGIETATGGFLDFNGQPTETEPLCYSLRLGPSPFVLLTLGFIAVAWFMMLPLEEWQGTGTLFLPFPFANIDVETWPLSER